MRTRSIQDQLIGNCCWGCGADNPTGLHLKSYWDEGGIVVARWRAIADFAAGPRHVLNGGIIATLLDCHGVCTAVANAYRRQGRAVGSEPAIYCATGTLTVEYLRPTPIDDGVSLTARVTGEEGRSTTVECTLESGGIDRARASVRAVQVPAEWQHGAVQ